MPVSSYPRVTVQGTSNTQNPQNGQALMLFNSTTQQYEAATAATFAGGGGGGDATAANQVTQINEAITTNINTAPSFSGYTIANALESSGGNSAADLLDIISSTSLNIQKTTKWNTYKSVIYYNASGTTTFSLFDAVRIVFNSNNIEVSALQDSVGNNILNDYFLASGTTYLANSGTEIISNGNSANDLFKEITVVGAAHFTVYYLITPYV